MIETICPFPSPSAHRSLADRGRSKDDLQPWTAARCHRILRQLECRLGTLRKLVQEARQSTARGTSKRAGSREDNTRPPKRTRYTYAQRRSTSTNTKNEDATLTTPTRSVRTLGTMNLGRCSPASERVDFPTPMLRRICAQSGSPGCSPKNEDNVRLEASSLAGELQTLRRLAPEGHYRIYEAIFGWLSSLLRSTEVKTSTPHPKSLLGMCLRKVPAALAEIETWDRQIAEQNGTKSVLDSSNASIELYGQLEAMGATGLGWKPLRLVVRSHAVSILSEAVSEGLFGPEFVRLLAELYLSFKCAHDAAAIVSNLPNHLPEPRSSSSTFEESSKLQPLTVLLNCLHKKDRHGAAFESLSTFLETRKLPLAWLYTKGFKGIWVTTLEATAMSKPQPSAIKFVCTAMEQLVIHKGPKNPSKQDTKKQALINVAAGLTATAITLGSQMCFGMSQPRRQAARRLMHILDRCIAHAQRRNKSQSDGGLFVLAMARYIAMANSEYVDPVVRRQAGEEFRQLFAADGVSSSQTQYRQALFLACSIAQCRGRACSVACHDVLSEICTTLDGIEVPDWFRNGLRMDGAFLLAQKTKDLRDLAFAEKLPATDKGLAGTGTVFSGWRWEEGISEWVLLSPASKTREHGDSGDTSARNQSPSRRGRERVHGWVREMAGESRRSRRDSVSKGGTDSHLDSDLDDDDSDSGDSQGGEDGQKGKVDSGDELSGEWEEDDSGICGLSLGNAARTSVAGSDGEPGGRNPGRNSRSGIRSDIMGISIESPTRRRNKTCGSQGSSSSSASSAASSASCPLGPSQELQTRARVGGRPTKSSKRARTTRTKRTRTQTQMQTGTGAGRLRGISQRGDGGGGNDDGDDDDGIEGDDWDELV
ncbi:hypothetical protein AK830_g297 [Neonectria ditissima]|uniref:Uncharacterized protein n=1 Tax=Neonectria ditissima TaxID=78410 RepID=A0A0P7BQ82_9HYPO|nr:hypothetical protein AK830_g297 [Neonectria ditissima]